MDQWIVDDADKLAKLTGLDRADIFRLILGAGMKALTASGGFTVPLAFMIKTTKKD